MSHVRIRYDEGRAQRVLNAMALIEGSVRGEEGVMPYVKKGAHGGPGRGQGRKHVTGKLRPYADREAIGKTSLRIGMRCVQLRNAKPLRSRNDVLAQVAKEGGISTARVDRYWKQVNRMLEDMRGDSPVSDYKPDTRARLSDNDYDDSSSGQQSS